LESGKANINSVNERNQITHHQERNKDQSDTPDGGGLHFRLRAFAHCSVAHLCLLSYLLRVRRAPISAITAAELERLQLARRITSHIASASAASVLLRFTNGFTWILMLLANLKSLVLQARNSSD
jgi:hypothetical protein